MAFWQFDWWRNEDNREGASAIISNLKVVIPALLVLVGGAAMVIGIQESPIPKDEPPTIAAGQNSNIQTGNGIQVIQGGNGTVTYGYSVEQHQAALATREAQLRSDLERASTAEKALIEQELVAVTDKLSDIEASYTTAVEELRQLRQRIAQFEGQVPQQQLEAAQQALYQGDRSLADALFAEIEQKLAGQILLAAEAAYGRGKIAEHEIRWQDAYSHYKRATELSGEIDHLRAYARMTWRLAKGDEAVVAHEALRDLIAERSGTQSAAYATQLNNLAGVIDAQGRFAEAEELYQQALAIDRATIGEGHPDYATDLNNLAGVIDAQGRFVEAEELYQQALAIDRATIGEGHPDYAIHLNNLAGVIEAQGRFAEAEEFYQQALQILEDTLPSDHPHIALVKANHAGLPKP